MAWKAWTGGRFHHAYGPANDTPNLLRTLAEGTDAEADRACGDLWGSVNHQGTVYPATALTMPFLLQIAEDVSLSGRRRCIPISLMQGFAVGAAREDPVVPSDTGWFVDLRRVVAGAVSSAVGLALSDSDAEVRLFAAWWTEVLPLDVADRTRVHSLAVADPDPRVRAQVTLTLGHGDARLAELTHDPAPVVRLAAAAVQLTGGDGTDAVEIALEAVPEAAPVLATLPAAGDHDLDAVRLIARRLGDASWAEHRQWIGCWLHPKWAPSVRISACYAASEAAELRRSWARDLLQPLQDLAVVETDREVLRSVCYALSQCGLAGCQWLDRMADEGPTLLREHAGRDRSRDQHVLSLAKLRAANRLSGAAAVLATRLGEDAVTTFGALFALSELGPDAASVREIIRPFLQHGHGIERLMAARILGRLGETDIAVPVMTAAFRGDRGAANLAAELLAEVGPPASAAIPVLRDFLERDERPNWVSSPLEDDVVAASCVVAVARITSPQAGWPHSENPVS